MNQSPTQSIIEQTPGQDLYHNTLREVAHDIEPYLESIGADADQWDRYQTMLVPNRVINFEVNWENDAGETETNQGYRVQHSSARGPYKGGLRFDPSVNVDTLKFLALEQTFKNALTGLPLGSGKGGADFNPRGRSDAEIERFCQAFMQGLYEHIGPDKDVPAGDIGVGGREIGYMLAEYQRLSGEMVVGALTGKPVDQHGSYGRTEATGYGVVYLVQNILEAQNDSMSGKRVVISGSGNVATYAALKVIELGGRVVSLSDRGGYVVNMDGFSQENIQKIIEHKMRGRSLRELELERAEYKEDRVWILVADVYIPCATQNELGYDDAYDIVESGADMVVEGANMPCTPEAVEILQKSDVVFVPAKAANAGGVAVSGLEMEQNRLGEQWTFDTVDGRLQQIMKQIFETITQYGTKPDRSVDYLRGANVGGYVLVDQAMKN